MALLVNRQEMVLSDDLDYSMIMFIDIIIPTFNRSNTLSRAIDSVLGQTYKDFNLIIVDDGSTDDTQNIVKPYLENKNVHYLFQENKGVSAARNYGIQNSTNEWIAFLDSDDEWLSQKLEKQIQFHLLNPKINFIHSNENWIRNGVRVNAPKKFDKSNDRILERSLATCLISPSTVLMKRELGFQFKFFNEDMTICEDYDLWLKILLKEEVGFVPDYLINKYGGHEDQLSTMYDAMDYWRVKSLVNILREKHTDDEVKKKLIQNEIEKKSTILLKGLQKHNQTQKYAELTALLESIK